MSKPRKSTVLLEHHLKQLKLPTMLKEYSPLAGSCSQQKCDYPTYLLRLCEKELADRQRRAMDNWTEVCGSERLTGAMVDRLTHKVHIVEANGQSYRLEQSRKRLARKKNMER